MAEDNIVKALIEIILRREGVRFKIGSEPEKVNRMTKDIEVVLVSDNRRIAVEHTRIESFTNQISNVHRLNQARTRIEKELKGRVPDDRYFVLTLPTEYLCALKKMIWISKHPQSLHGWRKKAGISVKSELPS
jgi:hypothetical protein